MAEVFISYSHEVRPLVAPIAERLAELGVDAWFDREIPAGESFGAVIRARLKEAKAVVVCWSPEAIESQWVDSEADYAREQGTYVPVFVAPCGLLPPFNRIHTDDLSRWKGEASDPSWIKLVDRIARLIKRDGVAAAARAHATADEQARYEFARRFPDEPIAKKIWGAAEVSHRKHFEQRLAEARTAADARVEAERAALEARLKEAAPAFEDWLADERRAAANGPMPDPLSFIERAERSEDAHFRNEIAVLRSALTQAKANGEELNAAKSEIERLSGELSALRSVSKATDGDLDMARAEVERLKKELERALIQAKASERDLESAKAEIPKRSKDAPAPTIISNTEGASEPNPLKQKSEPPSTRFSTAGSDRVDWSTWQSSGTRSDGGRAIDRTSKRDPIEASLNPERKKQLTFAAIGCFLLAFVGVVLMINASRSEIWQTADFQTVGIFTVILGLIGAVCLASILSSQNKTTR